MDEIQQKIDVEMEVPAAEPAPAKKIRKRRISVPKGEGRLKLTKFDFILLQLIKEGKNNSDELRAIFNLEKAEFDRRVAQLREGGFINANPDSSSVFLSMRGINDYSIKWKSAADDWLGRKERKPRVSKEAKTAQNASETTTTNSEPLLDLEHTIQSKLPIEILWKELSPMHEKILELPEEKRAQETIDIMDLIRKYGPTDKQKDLLNKTSPFVERHMKNGAAKKKTEVKKTPETPNSKGLPAIVQPPSTSEANIPAPAEKPFYNRAISELSKQAAEIEEKGEKCELCKTGFLISVKQEEHNPKYGHCFCGAPYHKDCYGGIVNGDSKCIRCGRKLGSGADFKVEDAFKQIRDISF
ncbi:MAG: hypothetical protein V1658_00105 [Candidatus Micrarchaeota archaeon]